MGLYGISENFNISDYCELLQNGIVSDAGIVFAPNVSKDYKKTFKAAVAELKKNWTSETKFPMSYFGKY